MFSKKVDILQHKTLYQGFLQLDEYVLTHTANNGEQTKPLTRELLKRPPAVIVLPYDPKQDCLVLVEQFRIGCLEHLGEQAWVLEAIAGMVDQGENVVEAATRELFEETGLLPIGEMHFISEYFPSGGASNERFLFYHCEVDSTQAKRFSGVDEGEEIRVLKIPVQQAIYRLDNGKIQALPAAFLLHWFIRHYQRN